MNKVNSKENKNYKSSSLKKVASQQGGVNPIDNPDLLHVAEFEAGELYEGVTEDAEVSDSSDYRMITKSDDTVNTQGS